MAILSRLRFQKERECIRVQALREIRAVLDALAATPPEELRAAQLAEQNDSLLSVYPTQTSKFQSRGQVGKIENAKMTHIRRSAEIALDLCRSLKSSRYL